MKSPARPPLPAGRLTPRCAPRPHPILALWLTSFDSVPRCPAHRWHRPRRPHSRRLCVSRRGSHALVVRISHSVPRRHFLWLHSLPVLLPLPRHLRIACAIEGHLLCEPQALHRLQAARGTGLQGAPHLRQRLHHVRDNPTIPIRSPHPRSIMIIPLWVGQSLYMRGASIGEAKSTLHTLRSALMSRVQSRPTLSSTTSMHSYPRFTTRHSRRSSPRCSPTWLSSTSMPRSSPKCSRSRRSSPPPSSSVYPYDPHTHSCIQRAEPHADTIRHTFAAQTHVLTSA